MSGTSSTGSMQKWEYLPVPVGPSVGPTSAKEALDARGEQGWEFVAVLKAEPADLIIFKRPKQ